MRQSMTYGVLPNRDAFSEAFSEECNSGKFRIRNCPMIGNDDLTESELWNQVQNAANAWNNDSEDSEEWGDWASCVLSVLGFEWI
jgi:hypothetical protein